MQGKLMTAIASLRSAEAMSGAELHEGITSCGKACLECASQSQAARRAASRHA